MLSIVQQPSAINFSKNPISFEVEADSIWKMAASKRNAVTRLVFSNVANSVAGTKIVLSWNGKSITFMCVPVGVALDNDADEYEAYNNQTPEAYVDVLIGFLNQNWEVKNVFSITRAGLSIVFTLSAEPCDNFTLTADIAAHPYHSATIDVAQTGYVPKVLSDYKIIAKIFVGESESTVSQEVGEFEVQPSAFDHRALFQLEDILNDQFKPLPPTNIEAIKVHHKQFSVRFSDFKDGKGRKVYETNTYELLRGGVNPLELPSDFLNPYYGDMLKSQRLMTRQPDMKISLPNVPEYLLVLCFEYFPDAFLETKATWHDGSTTVHTLKLPILETRRLYSIPTSFNMLNIVNGNKKIKAWTVQLLFDRGWWLGIRQVAYISKPQTYQTPSFCFDQTHVFLFENTLGGFDTFTTGEAIQSSGKIVQEVNITEGGNVGITRKDSTPLYKLGTGWIDTKHAQWLQQEFFTSKNIWLIQPDNTGKQVILKTDTIPTLAEREDAHRFEFEYQYAFQA